MEMAEKQEETTEWQTFFSKAAQREYYYNPETKIVTWILPDNDHADGKSCNLKDPVEDHDERCVQLTPRMVLVDNLEGRGKKRRKNSMNASTKTFVLLILSLIVTFVVWQRENTPTQTSDTRNNLTGRTGSRETPSTSRLQMSVEDKDVDESETLGEREIETLRQRKRIFDFTHGRMASKEEKIEEPVLTVERAVEKEHATIAAKAATPSKPTKTMSRTENQPPAISHEAREKKLRRNCMIPFAHLFSKICRTMSTTSQLFDAQQFVDTIMQ